MIRSLFKRLRRGFFADRRGTVMVEFAIALPILMFVMLAGVDLVRFAMLQQKLNRAAVTIADLVSQYQTISTTQLDQIFLAMEHIISPFPLGPNGQVIVSSVSREDVGDPVLVTWQRLGPGTATAASNFGTPGNNATLPAGFTVAAGENVIVAEVFYDFEPLLFESVLPSRRVEHSSLYRPRFGSLSAMTP
jgi:Flp pilus assembly protein TadG